MPENVYLKLHNYTHNVDLYTKLGLHYFFNPN